MALSGTMRARVAEITLKYPKLKGEALAKKLYQELNKLPGNEPKQELDKKRVK